MEKGTKTNFTFVGSIEKMVMDYNAEEEEGNHGTRFFIVMKCFDEELKEMSVYCRVQGQKARKVLNATDKYGRVEGLWVATLRPTVREFEGRSHPIHANLMHCLTLEMLDNEVQVHLENPPLLPIRALALPAPKESTGIWNWMKNAFAI